MREIAESTAMSYDERKRRRSSDYDRWALILAVILQFAAVVYGYAQLRQEVSDLHDTVQEIKVDVRDLHTRAFWRKDATTN